MSIEEMYFAIQRRDKFALFRMLLVHPYSIDNQECFKMINAEGVVFLNPSSKYFKFSPIVHFLSYFLSVGIGVLIATQLVISLHLLAFVSGAIGIGIVFMCSFFLKRVFEAAILVIASWTMIHIPKGENEAYFSSFQSKARILRKRQNFAQSLGVCIAMTLFYLLW